MTLDEIKQLSDFCRAQGIRRVKTSEIELEFGPGGAVDEAMVKKFQDMIDRGLPSDEEAMFWSAPGFAPEAPEEPKTPTARGRKS